MVKVHVFDRQGQLVGPVESPEVVLSEAEWQQRLTPAQFRVLRNQGTEPAFCGNLLDNKQAGVYACIGCRLPLFSSDAKFNSGTGWPSFFQPAAPENVRENVDRSHGMVRVEIVCARCQGHLGHVFEDGPRPTGRRFCLNSESLFFVPRAETASLAEPVANSALDSEPQSGAAPSSSTATKAQAVLAGGCFWCTEAAFEELIGVSDVESGYTGGAPDTANYEAVCSGSTGHAEAIRITYDPRQIRYEQLLDVFFDAHDPTQLNGQGADHGTQYRSAIFYANDDEKRIAEQKIQGLTKSGKYRAPIVTKLEPLTVFHTAEQYHQDYARRNPGQPYIRFHALPKACEVRERHPELIKPGR